MLNLSNQRVDEQLWNHYPLRTLRSLPSLNASRQLGRLMIGLLIGVIVILFMPWQQNITGDGSLTALSPQDRPQTLQNAIPGRIERWNVAEGDLVKKGDTLLVISEIKDDYFDPNLPQRLHEQLQSKQGSMSATDSKITALDEQMAALRTGLQVKLSLIHI